MDEKITFKEIKKPEHGDRPKRMATVNISEEAWKEIDDIAEKTLLPKWAVSERLIRFALKHIDWEE
jgi:hypothetical protein